MIAEACHSLADTVNQILLLLGMKLASRPDDDRHQFGYAQERYFWAFVVAISIFTIGAVVALYEGFEKILHYGDPAHGLKHPIWGVGVLSVSIVLELVSFTVAVREFRKIKGRQSLRKAIGDARDPVIITVLMEDSAALLGLVAALVGLVLAWTTGNMIFDGIASVVVGVVLALVAFLLARESKDMLLGESVKGDDAKRIDEIVKATPKVCRLLRQATMHLGPEDVLAALKIEFADGMTTDEVECAIDAVEQRLRAELPHLRRIWIEPGTRRVAATPAVAPEAKSE
jgi:cation diffusion facilitator family transporter